MGVSVEMNGRVSLDGAEQAASGIRGISQATAEANRQFEQFAQGNQVAEALKVIQRLFEENARAVGSFAESMRAAGSEQGAFSRQAMSAFQGASPQSAAASRNTPAIPGAAGADREQRIRDLDRNIEDLTETLRELIDRTNRGESDDFRGINNISQAINQLEAEKRRLEADEKEDERKDDRLSRFFGFDKIAQAVNLIGNVAQAGYTYRQDVANGNFVGAERRMGTSIAGNIGGAATSIGTGLMATGVGVIPGAIIGGAGLLTSLISRIVEGGGAADDAEAAAYERNFQSKYGAARAFRDMGGDMRENARTANGMYSEAFRAAAGTGLDTNEILDLMARAASYGAGESAARSMARNAGLWEQETGASRDSLMRLQGTAERYGLGSNALATAYGGLVASGMGRGQFDEFLNGLQSVIEDGISNGFTSSAEEVAQSLTLFARLSGNSPLWQGQQGAQRLVSMNHSLSNATNMASVNDMIVYGALDTGGGYIETMKNIERGLNDPKAFGKIAEAIKNLEGGNTAAMTERFRQIFGVNYTQAEQLLRMSEKIGRPGYTNAQFQRDIKAAGITPDTQTEYTFWKDKENAINNALNRIGQDPWNKNLQELNETAKKYWGKAEDGSRTAARGRRADGGLTDTMGPMPEVNVTPSEDSVREAEILLNGTAEERKALYEKQAKEREESRKIDAEEHLNHGIGSLNSAINAGTLGALDDLSRNYIFSPWKVKDMKIYKNLADSGRGNEKFDELIKKKMAEFGIADGDFSNQEMAQMLAAMNNNKGFWDLYNDKSTEMSKLENMLTRLFQNLTINTQ